MQIRTVILIFFITIIALMGCNSKFIEVSEVSSIIISNEIDGVKTAIIDTTTIDNIINEFNRARKIDKVYETIHPITVEIKLNDGNSIFIKGGEETYLSVESNNYFFNIEGPKFVKLMNELDIKIKEQVTKSKGVNSKIISLYNDQYKVIEGVVYYVLVDEYLENNDPLNPNVSELIRQYFCYDGTSEIGNITPYTDMIAIDKVDNLDNGKKVLKESYSESLKLMDNTIVSAYVKEKWKLENYDTQFEYHENCPENLVFEDL